MFGKKYFLVDFETWYEILSSSLNMQIFGLTCLSLTSITFERIELQSSDWTQKTRFFKLYPNMLSVHFDFILICSFSGEKLKSVFFFYKKTVTYCSWSTLSLLKHSKDYHLSAHDSLFCFHICSAFVSTFMTQAKLKIPCCRSWDNKYRVLRCDCGQKKMYSSYSL